MYVGVGMLIVALSPVGESSARWNKVEEQKGDIPSARESHIMWWAVHLGYIVKMAFLFSKPGKLDYLFLIHKNLDVHGGWEVIFHHLLWKEMP